MAEDAIKLPLLGWELPKPKKWDLVALAALGLSALLAGFNLQTALGGAPGESISGLMTAAMVIAQMALASVSLLILGKTAKEGTLWGNLISVGASFVAMSGMLLATALWAVA